MVQEDWVERLRKVCQWQDPFYAYPWGGNQAIKKQTGWNFGQLRAMHHPTLHDRKLFEESWPVIPNQCTCDLCGRVFLWRAHVKDFEMFTRAVENPINYALIHAARDPATDKLNILKAGTSRIRCRLCWEAYCNHCSNRVALEDTLFAEKCGHCGQDLEMAFRRTIESQLNVVKPFYARATCFSCQCCGKDTPPLNNPGQQGYYMLSYEPQPYQVSVYELHAYQGSQRHYKGFARPGVLCRDFNQAIGKIHVTRNPLSDSAPVTMKNGLVSYWQCRCRMREGIQSRMFPLAH